MKISYVLEKQEYPFVIKNPDNLGTLLTNAKGDYLHLGVFNNSSKFEGLTICNSKTLDTFKILDTIFPTSLGCSQVKVALDSFEKFYGVQTHEKTRFIVDDNDAKDQEFGTLGDLHYNDSGQVEEVVGEKVTVIPREKWFLGPSGGAVYDITNFEGELIIDLDMHKRDDYDEWGREYDVYVKNGVVFVHFSKKTQKGSTEYELFFGVKAMNFSYDLLKSWVEKEYEYSRQRNSLWKRYVFRLMKINVSGSKRLYVGTGFTEKEVEDQLFLLERHADELESINENMQLDTIKEKEFEKPLTQGISVAYKLSSHAMFGFLSKSLERADFKQGMVAGFPWFSDIWSRDELMCLRSYIHLGEFAYVKDRLKYYANLIDKKTGEIPRILKKGTLKSVDAVFLLAKRFEDLLFHLDEIGELDKVFLMDELDSFYAKLVLSFNRMMKSFWDRDKELLKVKQGDSWMDTLDLEYPLDIQVGFMSFVSVLSVLANLIGKKEDAQHYLDLEEGMKEKIREVFFRNGYLHNDPYVDKVTVNVFLAYYMHPSLFKQEDWERIFDKTLSALRTNWGGLSSLDKKDPEFVPNYSGENDASYHRGDSWYFMNNIAALVLHDCNEKKFRGTINNLVIASTKDILTKGALGYGSEISSASHQRAQGCLAQAWSSATYIEMIDKLFERRF